jgi:predicted O-methyltransferase YrrM
MTLPVTPQSMLDVAPIEWLALPREYQNPGEMEVLAALARSISARDMLEIGCRDGRTARLMLHNVPTLQRYQGIDVKPGYRPQHSHQLSEIPKIPGMFANDNPRFELILRPRGSLDLTADDLPPCDICYIDGDHGDFAVNRDSNLAFRIVRPGGLIVWHDYNNSPTVDVKKIIDFYAACGYPIKLIAGTWFAYMRNGKYV